MARKPVHLHPAGHLSAREAAWAAMRKLGQFTLDDLERATGEKNRTIGTYVSSLVKAGYLELVGHDTRGLNTKGISKSRNSFRGAIYRLVKDQGVEAPRVQRDGSPVTQGRGRENMWLAARLLPEFDWHELAEEASVDDVRVAPREAKDYVLHLHKAGYLKRTRAGRPGTAARYRMIPGRFTGPKPPMIQRVKQVYDPNLGEVVWPKECGQ